MKDKKGKIIIILMIIVIIILSILLVINLKNKNTNSCDTTKPISKEEYYENMHKLMFTYYKIAFDGMNIPEEEKRDVQVLHLQNLEDSGFPMDKFVRYKSNIPCDRKESFAIRRYKDGKYIINTTFSCGGDRNYEKR